MSDNKNILNEPAPDYEKAELDYLKEALQRSYMERFLMATRLYKIHKTMERSTITHKPFINK